MGWLPQHATWTTRLTSVINVTVRRFLPSGASPDRPTDRFMLSRGPAYRMGGSVVHSRNHTQDPFELFPGTAANSTRRTTPSGRSFSFLMRRPLFHDVGTRTAVGAGVGTK